MILGFSTQLNGKPTYFIEKIWKGLLQQKFNLLAYHRFRDEAATNEVIDKWDYSDDVKPKLHSLRDDEKDHWQEGMKIDFFINVRRKDMFRFAPVLPVVSTQEVFMTYAYNDVIKISIDDKELFTMDERIEFARNDGFDTWEDFFNFFYPKIIASKNKFYKAKLIHWTDLKY